MFRRRLITLVLLLSIFTPCVAQAAGVNYVIHIGDQLQVLVFGSQGIAGIQVPLQAQPSSTIATLSQSVLVLSDGSITYPLIGSLQVAGLTPDMAAAKIADALARYVRHPNVTVMVQKELTPSVKVLGAVDHSGQLELQEGDRLVDAVAKAGVSAQFSDLNHITLNRLVDGSPKVYTIDLYNMLLNADYSANPVLEQGDVVYVPRAKQNNLANLINVPFGLYYLYLLLTPGVNHTGAGVP